MAIIQNYRSDISDKVISLSNYNPLQPVRDKDYDVSKLNDRFIKISEAVRIVFESIGMLATTDRLFIPTFLKGYVNPVKNISVSYSNNTDYRFSSGLDASGSPITFTDERIVYSFPEIFDIATNSYEFLVFKNGYLANTSDYLLSNTSSGVKVFYKNTLIQNNDIVTLVVNRIYSPTYKFFKYTYLSDKPSKSYSTTIDVNQHFGYFQSVKYLTVAVRPANKLKYQVLNKENFSIVYDTYTTQATIRLKNYTLNKYDTLLILDSLAYFNRIINDVNITDIPKTPNDIELSHITETNEVLPIHVEDPNELEIWMNGHRLIHNEHFIIKNVIENNVTVRFISFFITTMPNVPYQIYVSKNSVFTNKSYSHSAHLNIKGVELLDMDVALYENLGFTYVEGQLLNNKDTMTVHDKVLQIKAQTHSTNFYYSVFIPNNPIVDKLISGFNDSLSESEKIIIATGGLTNFISNYESNLNNKVFNTYNTPLRLVGGTSPTLTLRYINTYQDLIFNRFNNNMLNPTKKINANDINSDVDDLSIVAHSVNASDVYILYTVDSNVSNRPNNLVSNGNPI